MLTFEQIKAIENALGPDAARPVVEAIQTTDSRVMSSLLAEVATKADFAVLRGEFREEQAKLRGEMNARFAKLEKMVKVLIGLTALAVAFFSPVAEKLIGFAK
ncbi:hypothetical protein [Solidesulfovibrio sp.]|uniref:hypothetical protein n=1 Tax=Solidesulfovibrio sp. TaxID=2910990 RepID=UPI002B1FCCAD|nr:hypothetical protein [Solidesulfovibrio sp.]MEA4854917.1 hypothetical protein [Solidesulfovibrio sp.]